MNRPADGVDRCECGCKYWDGGRCVDCGEPLRVQAVALREGDTVVIGGVTVTVLFARYNGETVRVMVERHGGTTYRSLRDYWLPPENTYALVGRVAA